MSHVWLQAIEGQDHVTLLLQPSLDPLLIGDAQAHEFFIAVHQMGDGSFGDGEAAGLEALMHLRDGAMLHKAPSSNEGNDIQAKFAMRQRPASFFFRMIAHMILGASRGMTLTDDHAKLKDALQGHPLSPAVVGHPQAIATLFTGLPKRRQGGCELRFGLGCSPCHRVPPACNKGQRYHLNVHLMSSRVCRSAFPRMANWS